MVIGNICTEIGDVLEITTDVPIIATTSLLTFSDSITGTTGTRFFAKLFQYSPDGIIFGDWQTLTNHNLQQIIFQDWNTPIINLRYERSGTDNTGSLQFNGITFHGTAIDYIPDSPVGLTSLFKDILYNNPEVFELTINLTKKLYEVGIVPNYIERGDFNVDLTVNDDDYIAYWKTVAHYFALFSIFCQQFKTLYFNRDWLFQYVQQYGLFLNGDEEMADVQYIIANLYDEYRKRGTAMVVIPKGTLLLDGSETIVDGEYLRLIGYNHYDDFTFQLRKRQYTGWWINNSSPCYKGLTHTGVQINKAPENTQDILDLSKYIVSGTTLITDGLKNVAQLSAGDKLAFFTPINNSCDYELTFWVKQDDITPMLQVYGLPYNHYGILMGPTLEDTLGAIVLPNFINGLITPDSSVYYFVRVILFAHNINQLNTQTNMNQGINLRSIHNQESMYWQFMNIGSGEIFLWDIKVRPLRTSYSTGFIQIGNFIEIWRKNNNGHYNNEQSNDLTRKNLFPYNTIQQITDLTTI